MLRNPGAQLALISARSRVLMPPAKKPPRGRPTQSDLEKRKARVLEVASKLFMTRGYEGTSLAQVSKLARVSPRMISAHFGNKADIFTQVINARTVSASLLAAETATGETLEDILYGAAKFAWTAAYSPGAVSFLRQRLHKHRKNICFFDFS